MHFTITYRDFDGLDKRKDVEADTEESARSVLGDIPDERIFGIEENRFASLKKMFLDEKLNLEEQATFLASYTAAIASGNDQLESLDAMAVKYKKFAKKMTEVRSGTSVSEKLRALNFDPQIVLLARIGEQSGRLVDLMGSAADDIVKRSEILDRAKKQLILPGLLTIIGIGMMIGLPLYAVPQVEPIFAMDSISFQSSIFTDLMFLLNDGYRNAWYLMLGGVVAIIALIVAFNRKLEKYPIFKAFAAVGAARRSVMFIMSFPPLYEGGIKTEGAIRMLSDYSMGRSRLIYKKMLSDLQMGRDFSTCFDPDDWSPLIVSAMSGIDNITPVDSPTYFGRIRPLVITSLDKAASKVVAAMIIIGGFFTFFSMALVIIGMLYPVMSAMPTTPGMGG